MSVPQAIALLAIGGPGRYVCPKCNGGSDSEKCLTLVEGYNGSPAWTCYRATCGYRGGFGPTIVSQTVKEPRHYTRPYKPLSDEQAAIIQSRFGLSDGTVDGYSEADDRFILGVSGPAHQMRGHIAYSLSGGKPKSVNYWAKTDEPFNHWAMSTRPSCVVIVEDWFSAEKVREADAVGVALLGTLVTQSMITDISHAARSWGLPTYLALDRDAFGKALAYKGKYAEQFKYGLQVWGLGKDLKYETVERIKHAIESREFNFSGSN